MTLTYVYCLVRSARRPVLRGAPRGMAGGTPPRVLDAGKGLWVVASTVPAREYDEAALGAGLQNLDWVSRRAMAHEAVVEHFLTAPALLPMQMFTLFKSDDRALEHIAGDRRDIDRIMARIERRVEWGLRLTFDERAARALHDDARLPSSGSAYLARKRELLDLSKERLGRARTAAERVFATMAAEADESRRRTATEQAAPGSRLLLDAAFLVPARRSRGFRAALRRSAHQLDATGVVVSLTGPWPPYNFITQPARSPRSERIRGSAGRRTMVPATSRRRAKR